MAKITGLSGMIRGKSGPNVFRVSRGVQTMSQYNPNPNNPNTEAQRSRRSIFGTSAKMAKACYDDAVAGPLFKSISYKQRNALISAIISSGETYIESPAVPAIISAAAVSENWLPGIKEIEDLAGSLVTDNILVSGTVPDDGSFPTIDGIIVCLMARPTPGMSVDDLSLYFLPDYYVFESHIYELGTPAAPGDVLGTSVPVADFEHINPVSPYAMAEKSDGVSNDMKEYRCWYCIPFSYTYTGSGLEININGNPASIGKVQILWAFPEA